MRVGLLELRPPGSARHVVELAADVDVGRLGAEGPARDHAPFEQQVRVALQQHVVLERARLALVGVDAEVLRLRDVLGHEAPLHAGREARAAAPAQPGLLHLLGDLLGRHRQRLLHRLVAAPTSGSSRACRRRAPSRERSGQVREDAFESSYAEGLQPTAFSRRPSAFRYFLLESPAALDGVRPTLRLLAHSLPPSASRSIRKTCPARSRPCGLWAAG